MAGTSQMLDIHQRDFSAQILQATGLPRRLFPGWLKRASRSARCGAMPRDAGFPVGIPVISAGHDTQFALFGAGAEQDEPVLSSGTWEILMVRSARSTRRCSATMRAPPASWTASRDAITPACSGWPPACWNGCASCCGRLKRRGKR
jgi:sugar (pentulose or hexulose) kinase